MGKRKSKENVSSKNQYDVFGFDFAKVINYSKTLNKLKVQIVYLEYVLKEKKNNPAELDLDLYSNGPTFEEKIKNEIEYLKTQFEIEEPTGIHDKIVWMKNKHDFAYIFDQLIKLGFLSFRKDKLKMLAEHFIWMDGEMTAKQLKTEFANVNRKDWAQKPGEEVSNIIKHISNK
ncbi:MAG: hypothetical protein WCZ90_16385 [Melioribacteraceae bacterium]